jgi:hypothetical protein
LYFERIYYPSLSFLLIQYAANKLDFLKKLLSHPSDWADFVGLALSSKKAENSLAKILIQLIEDCSKEK